MTVPLPVPQPTGLDLDLYNLQVQWWDAKINLRSTADIEAKAAELRSKGAKDTAASQLLDQLNSQVYDAVVDKYNAIVNLDKNAYDHAVDVIKAGRAKGSTLKSDNTGLDQANLRVLNDKMAYWDAEMVGHSTENFTRDATEARAYGATITINRTALDDANQAIANAKVDYYDGWANLDQNAQDVALKTIAAQQSRGDFFGRVGLIGDNTTLDKMNHQVMDAKIAWWNAKVDGDVAGMQHAAQQEAIARSLGATIPVYTKLDDVNQQVFDRIDDFQQAIQSFDFQTAAQKLMEITDLQKQGATIGVKKTMNLSQYGLNQVLFQTQSSYWNSMADEDSQKMSLAHDTADYLRNVLGAQDTQEGRNMGLQNSLLLDGKKNYWNAYANLDEDGMQTAMKQIADAVQNGATISPEPDTQIDIDNQQIITDKIKHWVAKGDPSQEAQYEDDANSRRSKATSAGVGGDLISGGATTKLDQVFSDWYNAKKNRWDAEANGEDQSPFIAQGRAEYETLSEFDDPFGLITDSLNAAAPDGLFNIDIQNRAVLDSRNQINDLQESGQYDEAQKVFNDAKKLLGKGATLDIGKLVELKNGAVTDADILNKIKELLFNNEGNFDTVTPNDNNALSIGRYQWHADRAKNLLERISAANPAQARQLLGDDLYAEVNSGADWSHRTVSSAESAKIQKLLATDQSHQIQLQQADEDAEAYITEAKHYGLKDPKAIVYFADLWNIGPAATDRIMDNFSDPSKVTLDDLHNAAMRDTVMGASIYASRRKHTYDVLNNWNIGTADSTSPTSPTSGSTSQMGSDLIATGKKLLGTVEYSLDPDKSKIVNLNETTPEYLDCSSFVASVYLTVTGKQLPRTTWDQRNMGVEVSQSDLKVGDLVFFDGDEHVGLYEGQKDGVDMILHCGPATNYTAGTVKETAMQYLGSISHIRRIV